MALRSGRCLGWAAPPPPSPSPPPPGSPAPALAPAPAPRSPAPAPPSLRQHDPEVQRGPGLARRAGGTSSGPTSGPGDPLGPRGPGSPGGPGSAWGVRRAGGRPPRPRALPAHPAAPTPSALGTHRLALLAFLPGLSLGTKVTSAPLEHRTLVSLGQGAWQAPRPRQDL